MTDQIKTGIRSKYILGATVTPESAAAVFPNTYSMAFDGSNEYVTIPDHASLDFSTAMSISCWIKGGSGSEAILVGKADFGQNKRSYFLERTQLDRVGFIISADGGGANAKFWEAMPGVLDSNWHHVVFTFSSGTPKMYIDGVEVLTFNKYADGSVPSLYNSDVPLFIGAGRHNGNPTAFWPGNIDEVSFWNVALSGAEVTALYNSGAPGDLAAHSAYANLVSWYRMGDDALDSASVLRDQKGSNHGTVVNMEAGDLTADVP